jgi:vitamin K-dependent gamma-carboxylase
MKPALSRIEKRLFRPIDPASLAAFRVLFGLLMLVSAGRFFANGWIDRFFVQPSFHFKYWGFAWVQAGPPWAMYLAFGALAVLAALVTLGLFYRVAIALFFLLFTYLQLIDVTLYLNHYYLVSLLALLLVFVPAHATWSLDARLRPRSIPAIALAEAGFARRSQSAGGVGDPLRVPITTTPAFALYALRFQVAVVYTSAGLAKLQSDWLLEAQPLNLWLTSLTDFPLLGPLLAQPAAPYIAAWAGFLFDSTVALFLSWRRTRAVAFAAVLAFHLLTGLLFPIGMFPVIMIAAATVFFEPGWPRRWVRRVAPIPGPSPVTQARWRHLAVAGFAVFALVQVVLPFRHHLYGGNVLWHEQGMRWSWRVMVREKNASVTYVVLDPASGRRWHVSPGQYLRDYQERDFATQPDLIWQLAQRIGHDFRQRAQGPVEVRADVQVSLNGRRAAPLIDPGTDLLKQSDGLTPKPWILSAPRDRPPHLLAIQ